MGNEEDKKTKASKAKISPGNPVQKSNIAMIGAVKSILCSCVFVYWLALVGRHDGLGIAARQLNQNE